jgi:hypothetical protein
MMPSAQWVATHAPLPSHTTPPLSVQAVPFATFVVPHACAPLHVLTLQTVVCAAQSLACRHATHAPLPSQSLPALSLHAVALAAFCVPQHPPAHVRTMHAVLVAGHVVGTVHVAVPASHVGPVSEPESPASAASPALLVSSPVSATELSATSLPTSVSVPSVEPSVVVASSVPPSKLTSLPRSISAMTSHPVDAAATPINPTMIVAKATLFLFIVEILQAAQGKAGRW